MLDVPTVLAVAGQASTPDSILIVLGVVAIIPGLWAAWNAWRDRSGRSEHDAAEAGVGFAKEGFAALQAEVGALREERKEWQAERERWTVERERWHAERSQLTIRLEELQYAVHRLCAVMEQNNVPVPDVVGPLLRKGRSAD